MIVFRPLMSKVLTFFFYLLQEAELSLLKGRLKEVESMGVANSRELGDLKSELGSVGVREREWGERCDQLRKQVEQLQRENDALRKQHLTQVFSKEVLYSLESNVSPGPSHSQLFNAA
jgi:predicted  nucleic acid-binding Zn-ribbon protein